MESEQLVDYSDEEVNFRCGGRLHGIRIGDTLEILCRSCKYDSGVTVHYFDVNTGKLKGSRHFHSALELRRIKRSAKNIRSDSAVSAAS